MDVLKKILPLILFLVGDVYLQSAPLSPEQALQKLMDGNQRFVNDESRHPNRAAERRMETALSQEPFAIILGCSDSRVAPEIIFDQGIGDLFIVRVAGNVSSPLVMASIEFSAIYLHSPLILVMGHESCGAVQAVLQGKSKDIEAVAERIEPAVKMTKGQKGNRLENTIKANVLLVTEQLKANPAFQKLVEKNQLLIRGAYYNFHTGQVELL